MIWAKGGSTTKLEFVTSKLPWGQTWGPKLLPLKHLKKAYDLLIYMYLYIYILSVVIVSLVYIYILWILDLDPKVFVDQATL